jgi:hypothetical protein
VEVSFIGGGNWSTRKKLTDKVFSGPIKKGAIVVVIVW